MASQSDINNYQAEQIKVLEGLEPVRKRPGMYIGSTDAKGLHHLVKEILDNAVDEAIAGFGQTIQLFRDPITDLHRELFAKHQANKKLKAEEKEMGEQVITVVDSGRGIPVEQHASGISAMEVVMTKLHAGGKFESKAYKVSGGLHGIGSSAVNALSCLMQIAVKRNNKYYYQYHSRGIPHAPVAKISETQLIAKFPQQSQDFVKYESGTIVQFIADPLIFKQASYSPKNIIDIVKDRAYLMAGIYFQLFDRVIDLEQHFYFEGGIRSLVEHINMSKKSLHRVFYLNDEWIDEENQKEIGIEIAIQYNDSYKERVESYVNVINTPDGGTHVQGFRLALSRVIRDYAEKNGLIKEKENFVADDLKEGLTAVVFVKMPSNDLQFESQTKGKLNNAEAQSAVYRVFKKHFATYLEEHPKVGRIIVEKVLISAPPPPAAPPPKMPSFVKVYLRAYPYPENLLTVNPINQRKVKFILLREIVQVAVLNKVAIDAFKLFFPCEVKFSTPSELVWTASSRVRN